MALCAKGETFPKYIIKWQMQDKDQSVYNI